MRNTLYRQGHYGPHIILSTLNWWGPSWTTKANTECTEEELLEVLNYSIYFGPSLAYPDENTPTISGQSNAEFDARFKELHNGSMPYASAYRNPSYNAVWASALALNAMMNNLKAKGQSWSSS
ncbi:hypothetical protein CAPTEDRAFT_214831 [Capitella teleta]|uniref:Receptor ligand binding region domain-containing protein n=1 Tax=Capitella teleta TaxID=283909 RepID=R7V1S4_CAPTE|nr:hypothetical protein CAPTEDRAFT_214831 [Capitella teleta]|eukprot:ELU12504.1 hypothetical protein CAPTEDRAFT_214831 [Capitella teleta]